nr:YciI family protein [Mucilaginibacter sp. L294]
MKKIFLFTLVCVIALGAKAQSTYNKALADSLGADEYGMKMYTFVILKTGENKTTDKAIIDSAFKGHMANIGKLAANGKLVVAGPMGKNDKGYRGIFIFNVKTVAEAQELLKSDPAVQSKILEAEIYPWYGSAALPVYLETHKKIEKTSH